MASNWIAYNDLAWTEEYLVAPDDYKDEVNRYIKLIQEASLSSPNTLLHFGCGAGGHDHFFKQQFSVTGVDLSQGMLQLAHAAHPELEYIEGDMRSLRLNRLFDAVAIPDAIDYMTSITELQLVLATASAHLKKGGVLLIVANIQEQFQNNNFAYSGTKGDIHVTLLENNYINPDCANTYEATLVYLIRNRNELTMHSEQQQLGIFPLRTWRNLFGKAGFSLSEFALDGLYDEYLLGDGEYPLTIFVAKKL